MKPHKDMQELGRVIREARERQGLSARKLEIRSGLNHSFISKLEAGRYDTVSADSLTALAGALAIPLEDLYSLAGFQFPAALPSFGPYLRTRYGEELPAGALAELSELFDSLRHRYPGSDQVDDEGADTGVARQSGGSR